MPEGPRQRLLLALAEPGECPSPTLFPFPSLTRALGGGGRRRLHAAPLLYISPGPGPCRPSAPHCLHELWAFWGSRAAPPPPPLAQPAQSIICGAVLQTDTLEATHRCPFGPSVFFQAMFPWSQVGPSPHLRWNLRNSLLHLPDQCSAGARLVVIFGLTSVVSRSGGLHCADRCGIGSRFDARYAARLPSGRERVIQA